VTPQVFSEAADQVVYALVQFLHTLLMFLHTLLVLLEPLSVILERSRLASLQLRRHGDSVAKFPYHVVMSAEVILDPGHTLFECHRLRFVPL
jgi:hypothetical protein